MTAAQLGMITGGYNMQYLKAPFNIHGLLLPFQSLPVIHLDMFLNFIPLQVRLLYLNLSCPLLPPAHFLWVVKAQHLLI